MDRSIIMLDDELGLMILKMGGVDCRQLSLETIIIILIVNFNWKIYSILFFNARYISLLFTLDSILYFVTPWNHRLVNMIVFLLLTRYISLAFLGLLRKLWKKNSRICPCRGNSRTSLDSVCIIIFNTIENRLAR